MDLQNFSDHAALATIGIVQKIKYVVSPENVFEINFYYFKLAGIQFMYEKNWKGNMMKYLAYYNMISLLIYLVVGGYFILFKIQNVEQLTDMIGPYVTVLDAFVEVSNFYFQRRKCHELILLLFEIMKNGEKNSENFLFFRTATLDHLNESVGRLLFCSMGLLEDFNFFFCGNIRFQVHETLQIL